MTPRNRIHAESSASRPRKPLAGWRAWRRLMAFGLGTGALIAATPGGMPLLLTQVPHRPHTGGTARFVPGALDADLDGARVVLVQPDGAVRILSDGLPAATDPDLSFDAQKVLFAGRQSPDAHWRVYEIGLDGQGLRAVTPEHLDARNPIYVSTLFTLDSPEPWFTTVFVGSDTGLGHGPAARVWNLYNVNLDGSELRRLTWTPYSSLDPWQMWDGRVVYAAERRPLTRPDAPLQSSLFATHIEGADTELYGAEQGQGFQRTPCATEGGLMVFVETDTPGAAGAGQLACVTQRRPHLEYRRLTRTPDRLYACPHPWKGNTILVSSRAGAGDGSWGVWSFDADAQAGAPVYDDPDFHDVQARIVQPRPRPDGHSTVVNMTATSGTLYGLNCYAATEPMAEHVRTGEVKRVRFIEGVLPGRESRGEARAANDAVPRRLVGEAPVEEDGSFNVEVPASTPLLLQTLDERGLALATCGWIWVQPKETRGCIGCHEDPERIPENEYVLALRRPSNRLTLPPDQRRTLTFRDHIAPILQQHCALADCHASHDTPLHLELTSAALPARELEQAYRVLTTTPPAEPAMRAYITPGSARTSPLVWHLFGTNTSRPWDASATSPTSAGRAVKPMPPSDSGHTLRPEEIHTVVQWIDLGALFDAAGGPMGGSPLQQAQAR